MDIYILYIYIYIYKTITRDNKILVMTTFAVIINTSNNTTSRETFNSISSLKYKDMNTTEHYDPNA